MLTKEQILDNQKKFMEVNKKRNIFSESLLTFLGEDYFSAPASSMLSLHNAFPGGLLDHSIKVCRHMLQLNKILPKDMQQHEDSIYKVAFISEIGKTYLYKECKSKWHRENQGKMYEFNEELESMRVGERSAYYAMKNGVQLLENEYQAIINIDKTTDDKQARWHGSVLSQLLRQAIDLSILIEQDETAKVE